MPMSSIIVPERVEYEVILEDHIDAMQLDMAFLQSLLNSFWTGDVPDNASLDHMVLAKAGRLRLAKSPGSVLY